MVFILKILVVFLVEQMEWFNTDKNTKNALSINCF